MKTHPIKMYALSHLLVGFSLHASCVSSVTLDNIDVQGTYMLVEPINMALNDEQGISATIFAKRKNGEPLSDVAIELQADFCRIEPASIPINAEGIGRARIYPQEAGRYKMRMLANIRSFQIDMQTPAEINVLQPLENVVDTKSLPIHTGLSLQVPIVSQEGVLQINYNKTVRFESDDKLASLPQPYTYTPEDRGVKMFSGAFVLRNQGKHYVRVIEDETGKILYQQDWTMVAQKMAYTIENLQIVHGFDVVADGTDEAQISFVVADSNGLAIENQQVMLQIGGSNNQIAGEGITDAQGFVSFTVRSLKAETKSLTIAVDNVSSLALFPQQQVLRFVAGAPVGLRFGPLPSLQLAGLALVPQPTVRIVDRFGNTVEQNGVDVTLSLFEQAEPLQGVTTRGTSQGIAVFDGIGILQVGSQVRLQANAQNLQGDVSGSIQIVANAPSQLVLLSQPPSSLIAGELIPALQVQIQDAFGNIVTDAIEPVTLGLASGEQSQIDGNLQSQPVFGVALFTNVRILQSGSQSLLLQSQGLVNQTSLPILVHPAAVSVAQSSWTVSAPQMIADGIDQLTFDLQLKDGFGNQASGVQVALSTSHPQALLSANNMISDSQGRLQLTLQSTYAGQITISAVVGGSTTLSTSIMGLPGLPDEVQTSCALDGNQLVANLQDQRRVTCRVVDTYGNAVPGVVVYFSGSSMADTLTPSIGETDAMGLLSAVFRTSLAESKVITATIESFDKSVVLLARPGPLSVAHSTLVASPTELLADNTTPVTLVLQTLDAYGNAVPSQGVFVYSSGTGNTLSPTGGFSDAQGIFTATLQSNVAEEKIIVATLSSGSLSTVVNFRWPVCSGDLMLPLAPLMNIGDTPAEMVHGDFNRDGKMDIAATSNNANGVYIYIGRGDGTFQNPNILAVNWNPDSMAVADMNRDNILDLVVVIRGSNQVGVYLGVGNGSFTGPTRYGTGSYPNDVGVSDLNQDTFPDVVVVNLSSNTIGVYYGGAGGVLSAATNYATENQPTSVTIFDANRDGRLDLVVGAWNHWVGVYLAQAGGGFNNRVTYYANYTQRLASGDFNRDGIVDLVASNYWGNQINVLLGQSNGTFATLAPFAAGVNPWGMFVTDINTDGSPDVLVGNHGANSFSVLLGKGDGSFWPRVAYDVGNGPRNVLAADFNQDGKLDALTSNYYGRTLSLLFGQGNGTFLGVPTSSLAPVAVPSVTNVALADLDGDGHGDIVGASASTIQIKWGNAEQTFAQTSYFNTSSAAVMVEVGDVNNDGLPDILACWRDSSTVIWLRNLGGKTFASPTDLLNNGSYVFNLYLMDVNRDNLLDLININYVWPRTVSVRLGNGNGTFAGPATYTLGDRATHLAFGELNNDNRIDMVASNSDNDNIRIFLGQGNGTFTVGAVVAVGDRPRGVAIGDVTGDGFGDIVVAHQAGYAGVGLLVGAGNGTFAPWTNVTSNVSGYDIALARINQDSRLDIVLSGHDHLYVAYHTSGSTFSALQPFPIARNGWNPVAVGPIGQGTAYFDMMDLDGDSQLDVVLGGTEESDVPENLISILMHDGQNSFLPTRYLSNGAFTSGSASGDLNEDGTLDIVAINPNSNTLNTYLGQQGKTNVLSAGQLTVGQTPTAVLISDVNLDGMQDIVAANWQFHGIAVVYGETGLSFATPQQIATGWNPVAIRMADMDNDGMPEVVVANRGSRNVTILRFREGVNLEVMGQWPLAYAPLDMVLIDANRDNLLDIVYVAPNQHVIGILFNSGNYGAGSEVQVAVGQRPVALDAQDINQDGFSDVLVANQTSSTISVLFSTGVLATPYTLARTISTTLLPTEVSAVETNGDQLLDLVVLSRGNQVVSIHRGLANQQFGSPVSYASGMGPNHLTLLDLDKDSRMELAVSCMDDGTLRLYSYQGLCSNP